MCLNCVAKSGISAMEQTAEAMGLIGACMALVLPNDEPPPWQPLVSYVDQFQRPPNLERPGDTGANYLAVCLGKWAEMKDTGLNSGTVEEKSPKKGGLGYKGGLIKHLEHYPYTLYAAFSGGTPEQDLVVAAAGIEALQDSLGFHLSIKAAANLEDGGFTSRWRWLISWMGLFVVLFCLGLFIVGPRIPDAEEIGSWSSVLEVVMTAVIATASFIVSMLISALWDK